MNKFYKILIVIAVCCFTNGFSISLFSNDNLISNTKDSVNFIYPLKVPMSLSGNYGELRSNHFHGGVDFRVGGVVGAPVYACEKGYVSRISVSGSGYGNALYITHPNGYVSVYGHLLKFSDKIAAYVKQQQYNNEEFAVDLVLDKAVFVVQKGEQIANAGNTGSSGGPHLHFEIRDTANIALNVFEKGYFQINDKTAPQILDVSFVAINKGAAPVSKNFKPIVTKNSPYLVVLPEFYVTINAIDRIDGSGAKFAVNEYKVYLDSAVIYSFKVGDVPFSKNRYINSVIDYSKKVSEKKDVVKSYVEPGNGLADRIYSKNDGVISLNDDNIHVLKIEVLDIYNNKSSKVFKVKRGDIKDFKGQIQNYVDACKKSEPDSLRLLGGRVNEQPKMSVSSSLESKFMPWYISNAYSANNLDVLIPAGALYNSIIFKIDTLAKRVSSFSPVWAIHSNEVPLHTPMSLEIKCDIPDSLASKALLAYVNKYGALSGAGGSYQNGKMYAKVSSFGHYTVAVDIVEPKIVCSLANGGVLKGSSISFTMRDNLSGIKKYRVEIDGKWVLGVLDSKTSRVVVDLKEANIARGSHRLDIYVWDNRDNKAYITRAFKW